jgi:hypothetical protein
MGRDGGPELVIRGEHPVVAMPVLPRRRHEGSEPVEELTWGKLDDDADARPRGLPPAPRANPVGRLVSREHVADAGDAAVFAADHGEPLQREGRPGTVSQQVLERQTIDTQLETKERDPDAGVNRKPTVLSSEHVGGRIGVEEPLHAEPTRDTPAGSALVPMWVGRIAERAIGKSCVLRVSIRRRSAGLRR